MGRAPCCDKASVKRGPWSPEEDAKLKEYIEKNGTGGNWITLPQKAGLRRCGKSCRLRWLNYLRPNIKHGEFSDVEDRIICSLFASIGSRWSIIAAQLPGRTDNDIKNYWNTHLKTKLKKLHGHEHGHSQDGFSASQSSSASKGQWERRLQTDIHMAKKALCDALSIDKSTNLNDLKPSLNGYSHPRSTSPPAAQSSSTTYASSTENIARLLQNWMKSSPKSSQTSSETTTQNSNNNPSEGTLSATTPEGFDSLFSFHSSNSDASQSVTVDETATNFTHETCLFQDESKPSLENQVPLSLLEKWLFDDSAAAQGHGDLLDMSLGENDEFF